MHPFCLPFYQSIVTTGANFSSPCLLFTSPVGCSQRKLYTLQIKLQDLHLSVDWVYGWARMPTSFLNFFRNICYRKQPCPFRKINDVRDQYNHSRKGILLSWESQLPGQLGDSIPWPCVCPGQGGGTLCSRGLCCLSVWTAPHNGLMWSHRNECMRESLCGAGGFKMWYKYMYFILFVYVKHLYMCSILC